MILKGSVNIDGTPIGSFEVDEEDVVIAFNRSNLSITEAVEWATMNGMSITLTLDSIRVYPQSAVSSQE